MKLKFYYSFFLYLFLSVLKLNAQITISGTVQDSANNPIPQASITLCKANSQLILAFAFSNAKGLYNLNYNGAFKKDSFVIKANAMGYKLQSKAIESSQSTIHFSLKAGSINLPTVVINNRPILRIKGDTLNYIADSFAYKQDRVIGDVLKRIPGVDVDNNGRISYNGKNISNLYLDGDDLLNDRYNIATQSVPNDLVDKIQILENHQPIKALKDASISDKVAINLNLKNKARLKLIGRAELSGGVDNIFNESLYLMAFKKKFKAINNVKATNAGNDISKDIISHNFNDFLKQVESNQPSNTLGLSNAGSPNLPLHRYLFNYSSIMNLNNLVHLKQDVILKANMFYLYDKQKQWYNYQSTTILPTKDTVKYLEQQQTQQRVNNTHLQLNLNINKEKFYINNTVIAEFVNYPSISNLDKGKSFVQQNLLQQNNTFSNEFNFVKTTKSKKVVEAYSFFSYLNKPEELNILPNLNSNVFNNGIAYNNLQQNFNIPTYYTNNYFSFRIPTKKIISQFKVGASGQWQTLQSSITATQLNNSNTLLNDSFKNYTNWQYYKPYINSSFDYLTERMQLSFNFPIQYHLLSYNDSVRNKDFKNSFLFFNPSIRLKYQTGLENYVVLGYSYSNGLSNISNIYEGMVLQNFRILHNNNIPIVQSSYQSINASFNYRKAIKIFFATLGVSYAVSKNPFISNTSFYKTIQQTSNFLLSNTLHNISINGSVSKYIFTLKSTASFKCGWQQNDWQQWQQGSLLNFQNNSINAKFSISSKITEWLNTSFSSVYNYTKSINKDNPKNIQNNPSTIQWQHNAEINFIANDNWYCKFLFDDYQNIQQQNNINSNYFFADASITHKANKIKADFSLQVQNIFNVTDFTTVFQSANNFIISTFNLRPRQFVLKASFNL